jgi:hypothetical protein
MPDISERRDARGASTNSNLSEHIQDNLHFGFTICRINRLEIKYFVSKIKIEVVLFQNDFSIHIKYIICILIALI